MDWRLEVIVVPVTDVDEAKAFYAERLAFRLDVDHRAGESFRVVQLTPQGSDCSVTLMHNPQRAGSLQGLHLVVTDIEVAHDQLTERGVEHQGPFHFGPAGRQEPGLHPDRADFGSFLSFTDPDGNGWMVQERRA